MFHPSQDDRNYYASLPQKRIATGALVFYKNELLIVQPALGTSWVLPGGTVEAEESPLEGLRRSIHESLNLQIMPLRLIAVDYIHNRDIRGEYIQFLFEAETLSDSQVQKIQLDQEDFVEFKFVDIEQAQRLLTPSAARRLESALIALQDGIKMIYLEDGNSPSFKEEIAFL